MIKEELKEEVEFNYKSLIKDQKAFIRSGKLRHFAQRREVLKQLRQLIKDNEDLLIEALQKDMGKPETEAYSAEILFVYNDIDHQLKHLKSWMRKKHVSTSLINQPGKSYLKPEPFGSVLVIAPWNYPLQLLIAPAVGAIAAGNSVVLKPSEITTHVESLIAELINNTFPREIMHVVCGEKEVTQGLIDAKPDYIFFTGSTAVGSLIMQQAAKHLIPVTLELGGKSPCIVHKDANIKVAARRIAWGKCMNAGQTCIAPDYMLVHDDVVEEFVSAFNDVLNNNYKGDILNNKDMAQIVNIHHFNRLKNMLSGDIVSGGNFDEQVRKIEPTLIMNPGEDHPAMTEEIFGPILPIITYNDINDVVSYINNGDKPLALYAFTSSGRIKDKILEETSSGGVCINDTIMHITSNNLPFGGIGSSGIGAYHGKHSFETFSHMKPVMEKATWIDPSIRYPPYKLSWRKLEKLFLWLAG